MFIFTKDIGNGSIDDRTGYINPGYDYAGVGPHVKNEVCDKICDED